MSFLPEIYLSIDRSATKKSLLSTLVYQTRLTQRRALHPGQQIRASKIWWGRRSAPVGPLGADLRVAPCVDTGTLGSMRSRVHIFLPKKQKKQNNMRTLARTGR